MSTFVVSLKTCVGCAPKYTYVYQVQSMSPDVKLVKTETKLPQPGIMGGSKTYEFTFAWNRHQTTQLPYVHFGKMNRLGQAVSEMLYTVNPLTLESVLVTTSDQESEKDPVF
jgi:hypothetical protein